MVAAGWTWGAVCVAGTVWAKAGVARAKPQLRPRTNFEGIGRLLRARDGDGREGTCNCCAFAAAGYFVARCVLRIRGRMSLPGEQSRGRYSRRPACRTPLRVGRGYRLRPPRGR